MRSFEIYGLSKATIILFTQFNINVRLFLIRRKRCQCNITTLSKNDRDSDQKLCLRCRGHSLFDIGVNYLRFLQHDRVDPSLMSLLSLPPPRTFRHFVMFSTTIRRKPFILLVGERHCVRLTCLAKKHNAMTSGRSRN